MWCCLQTNVDYVYAIVVIQFLLGNCFSWIDTIIDRIDLKLWYYVEATRMAATHLAYNYKSAIKWMSIWFSNLRLRRCLGWRSPPLPRHFILLVSVHSLEHRRIDSSICHIHQHWNIFIFFMCSSFDWHLKLVEAKQEEKLIRQLACVYMYKHQCVISFPRPT